MTTPKFQHDCARCIFLGQTIGGGRLFDCYACEGAVVTMVARYGDDGPEYYSTVRARPTGHAELFAAAAMWAEHNRRAIPPKREGLE